MFARRWWALGALALSVLTVGLDATVLSVALPTLAADLSATNSQLQWIQDAYILVLAGLLLPAGGLADRYGRKLLLVVGLSLFGASSVLATWAANAGELIAVRAVMGIGAAILMPITMAVLRTIFSPKEQTKAIAFFTIAMGLGVPLGPLVGGYLLAHFWWGAIFLINVPVVALALVAVLILVPESKDSTAGRVDLVGTALSSAGLVTLVYGIIEAPARGWGDALVVAMMVGGALLLAGFVAWQRRVAYPMIDLGLFARPRFLWGSVMATLLGFGLFGLLFVLPQYLQLVRGNTAFGTGVRLLPLMGGLIVSARIAERLVARVGSAIPVAAGMAITAAGLFLGGTTTVHSGYGWVAAWLAVIGLGVGLAMTPAMDAVLGALPPGRAGSGSALTMTLRQVGAALGVAILGSLLASAYSSASPAGGKDSLGAAAVAAARLRDPGLLLGAQRAYLHAMDRVLVICAVVTLAGGLLAALFLPARGPRPAVREESEHEQLAGIA